MFPNLFILNNASSEVLIEKHWVGRSTRKVVDAFAEHKLKTTRSIDMLPIIETPHFMLVHTLRKDIVLLTAVAKEAIRLM
mmetsp:Transcript_23943/g.44748  ORF Transcript_23943/g.44748 Transcript_23943/m.44748 type:complete len:80 (-) Transcript_23943:1299-1538(-)